MRQAIAGVEHMNDAALALTKRVDRLLEELSQVILTEAEYLVLSWRSAMSNMLAGIGLVLFAFGIPVLALAGRTDTRQRAR